MNKKPAVKILWLGAALFIAGCATHSVDWNNRVGVFTCDQAVTELGPPDKQAKLTDGQTVDEWVSRYNTGASVGVGTGFYSGPAGGGVMMGSSGEHVSTLRLTFNTNNVLTSWSRN
jgi:hypothetical protein